MERRLLDMGFPKGVKRDFAALEKRCIEAVRLVVEKGLSQAEAALPSSPLTPGLTESRII